MANVMARLGAWVGIVGTALFVSVFMIEGWLRPNYATASMYVSALSLGPRGWIQITNFVVYGLVILFFANGVAAELGRSARVGVALLCIIGISFVGSGPFVMDPVNVPPMAMTVHSKLHYFFGALVFSLGPISCFVFARYFAKTPKWRAFRTWTLALGIFMIVGIIFLKTGQLRPPNPPNGLTPWIGAIQRVTILPFLLWVFTFGLGILKRAR